MRRILEIWRIPAATLISALLVAGAYYLARGVEHPPAAQASEEAALLQAIAGKDSDADGLPDWEEALYGTDPKNRDTRTLGMTDGEAVAKGLIVPEAIANVPRAASAPGSKIDPSLPPAPADDTLTAAFSKSFFTIYMQAVAGKSGELTQADLDQITQQTLSSLATAVVPAPDFKKMEDLTIAGTGPDALKQFAAAAEAVLLANKTGASKGETEYLKAYLDTGDAANLDHIAQIAKAYRASAAGLAALPVPKEIATEDLVIIDAFARISEITSDFTRIDSDPLAAMLALGQYEDVVQTLALAMRNMGQAYAAAQVPFAKGDPGFGFAGLLANAMKKAQ